MTHNEFPGNHLKQRVDIGGGSYMSVDTRDEGIAVSEWYHVIFTRLQVLFCKIQLQGVIEIKCS